MCHTEERKCAARTQKTTAARNRSESSLRRNLHGGAKANAGAARQLQPLVGGPSAAAVKKLIAVSDDGSKLWQTSEPPMEMRINRAVDPPFIEGVAGSIELAMGRIEVDGELYGEALIGSILAHTHGYWTFVETTETIRDSLIEAVCDEAEVWENAIPRGIEAGVAARKGRK